ncbi:MAG TPA: universal stress protein [Candidatus Dormibacteraeota bacterium]|jgi:nucleotide-binding universal stress UspA family protein|nr:universal stress protein [Candidatus Dormibacteraeota bacterium]
MKAKRILLALAGAAIDTDVVRLAALIAKPNKAQIEALHVIEVQWNRPLDADLTEDEVRAEQLLEAAEQVARSAGVALETEYVAARTAWSAIVHEAEQRSVDLIIIGMPYRRRMGRVAVGRTVQNVFVSAPCEVIAVRERAHA